MSKQKILVVWSNYYADLAQIQLDHMLALLAQSPYDYSLEPVDAGVYEIPAVIQYFEANRPYQAYLPLGLLLKGDTDHYEFIWQHLKDCFIQFTMRGVMFGNGVISAPNIEALRARVVSGERAQEAYRAVDYLLRLSTKC